MTQQERKELNERIAKRHAKIQAMLQAERDKLNKIVTQFCNEVTK